MGSRPMYTQSLGIDDHRVSQPQVLRASKPLAHWIRHWVHNLFQTTVLFKATRNIEIAIIFSNTHKIGWSALSLLNKYIIMLYTAITQHHWKATNSRDACSNCACRKAFSLTRRVHHCRRCGDVFCKECVDYERRLNGLAQPDPGGRLYKVKCTIVY